MTIQIPFSSLLLASTAVVALVASSSATWSADHREAPLISNLGDRELLRCPTLLSLPMRVTVKVPPEVLRRANISVDHYTRSADGTVDASDYIIWNRPMGTTLTTIVNPGNKRGNSQVNEGYVTLPSLKGHAYSVEFRFESMTSGESCDLATRVDYRLPSAVVVYWSSGAEAKRTDGIE